MARGVLNDGTDFNTIKANGVYYVGITNSGKVSNFPAGSYPYGLLLVFSCNSFTSQLYVPDSAEHGICTRVHFASMDRWQKWQTIAKS